MAGQGGISADTERTYVCYFSGIVNGFPQAHALASGMCFDQSMPLMKLTKESGDGIVV